MTAAGRSPALLRHLALPARVVTISGSEFGSTQGSGVVWLGNLAGVVQSWSDTQVIASVATGALSGIARIQQNGVWSKALQFAVTGTGGTAVTLAPNLLNMVVGDTHTIEALGSSGQSLTGLTWATSDSTIVSLSTDNPPILTAVAAGHVIITAGGASADVTVSAGALPLGTVLWSNPGPGGCVGDIVPAVPSTNGVADVFAFSCDGGTVQAITADGQTAWSADLSHAITAVPDFSGGLVVANFLDNDHSQLASVTRLDGIDGHVASTYTAQSGAQFYGLVVHTDGTVFLVQDCDNCQQQRSVVGINSTGAAAFTIAVPGTAGDTVDFSPIIAGDGYAYVPYRTGDFPGGSCPSPPGQSGGFALHVTWHLKLLRIATSGAYDQVSVYDWPDCYGEVNGINIPMITNADTGTLLTWMMGVPGSPDQLLFGTALTNGTSATVTVGQSVPGQQAELNPVLQAQDGSFIGTVWTSNGSNAVQLMVAFDSAGTARWTVPNEQPQIATADGGVIGQSGITYDQNGSATSQTGNPAAYSWLGYSYQIGSIDQALFPALDFALSFQVFAQISPFPAGQGTAAKLVQNKTFLPAAIVHNQGNDFARNYLNEIRQRVPANQVAVDNLWFGQATPSRFLDALGTTNMVVAYIGHGLLQSTNGTQAMGLCFGADSNQCIVPTQLTNVILDNGNPATLLPAPPQTWQTLENGFEPKARVVFIAACGINDKFDAQWHLQSGQALIVPQYLNPDENADIDLSKSASEWEEILVTLAGGSTVSAAVNQGNIKAAANGAAHRWQVIGNGNVKIR